MFQALLIALGGAIGAVLRYLLSGWINNWIKARYPSHPFPYGILVVNSLGCFIIGYVAAMYKEHPILNGFLTLEAQTILLTGVLGGFTTFSSFSLEALSLIHGKRPGFVMLYILASATLGLLSVFIGYELVMIIDQLFGWGHPVAPKMLELSNS